MFITLGVGQVFQSLDALLTKVLTGVYKKIYEQCTLLKLWIKFGWNRSRYSLMKQNKVADKRLTKRRKR